MTARSLGKGRGLNYEQSPTWITQIRLRMKKLWCLEVEKNWRENLTGFSIFLLSFFLKTNGGKWEYLKGRERRNFLANQRRPHQPSPRVGRVGHMGPEGWSARVAHGLHTGWPRHGLWPCMPLSRTSHNLRPYSGLRTLISNLFFGLWIMTPSCTTMTTKIWQKVENSSRKITTNTTQRMRTKSSVATSFGLET